MYCMKSNWMFNNDIQVMVNYIPLLSTIYGLESKRGLHWPDITFYEQLRVYTRRDWGDRSPFIDEIWCEHKTEQQTG